MMKLTRTQTTAYISSRNIFLICIVKFHSNKYGFSIKFCVTIALLHDPDPGQFLHHYQMNGHPQFSWK